MRDRRSLIDTRRYQTNKNHIDSNYRAQQLHSNTDTSSIYNHHSEKKNDQNACYFRVEGQLRYHWGADQEIMPIINRRDKSPESSEWVTRRTELAKPGATRPHWNKNLGREIFVPRQAEENERREIKRIDLQLKQKKKNSTSAVDILEILETKYHKKQRASATKTKHTGTPNQLLQTILKKRWQPRNPELTPQYPSKSTATAQLKR